MLEPLGQSPIGHLRLTPAPTPLTALHPPCGSRQRDRPETGPTCSGRSNAHPQELARLPGGGGSAAEGHRLVETGGVRHRGADLGLISAASLDHVTRSSEISANTVTPFARLKVSARYWLPVPASVHTVGASGGSTRLGARPKPYSRKLPSPSPSGSAAGPVCAAVPPGKKVRDPRGVRRDADQSKKAMI